MKKNINGFRQVAAAIVIPMLLWGCGAGKTSQPDSFFDTWRAEAESAQGYSPRAAELEDADTGKTDPDAESPGAEPEVTPVPPLPTTPITLSMHDAPIVSVLRALARAADQSIMISDAVTGTANLSAIDTPWDSVFLGVMSTYGLVYEQEGDILKIKTPTDLAEDLEKEKAELNRQKLMRQMENSEAFETKIYFLKYIKADALGEVLEKLMGESETASNAETPGALQTSQRSSSTVDTNSNALIVHASREKIRQAEQIISQLDRPTRQVLIEAKIVETSQSTARALGVQWGGLNLEQSGSKFNWIGGPLGSYDGSIIDATDGSSTLFLPAVDNIVNFPADMGDVGATLGLQFQDLRHNYLLSMQLSALQEEGKLNILSSPSITTLDNQEASIASGREVPYQAVDENDNITIVYKEAELSLNITPHIIDEDTLRLSVSTHKDELDFTNTVGGYPTIITKNAETQVILFNGQTMVIGGLSKETTSDAESGVPVLKDIPFLGALFRNTDKNNDMEEILIFITPHILVENPEKTTPRDAG
jgi:type IV pilus assembly protein PilQ